MAVNFALASDSQLPIEPVRSNMYTRSSGLSVAVLPPPVLSSETTVVPFTPVAKHDSASIRLWSSFPHASLHALYTYE
jgi:hypothetical protein